MYRLFSVIILLSLCSVHTTRGADKLFEDYYLGVAVSSDSKIILSMISNEINQQDVILCEYDLIEVKNCQKISSPDWMRLEPSDAAIDLKTGGEINNFEYNQIKISNSPSILLALIVPNSVKLEIDFSHSAPQETMSIRTDIGTISVSMCTSTEGVHILSSELNQHLYMHLGYEVSPSCAEDIYE